jgi:hypothetical protein
MSIVRLRSFTAAICAVLLLLVAILGSPALAQEPAGERLTFGERPIGTATRVTDAPVIDGVLDDSAWQNVEVLGGFTQAEPFSGQPASLTTDVRIVYDDDALYVSALMHDSDPSRIVTTDTRRDSSLTNMDSFQIILDTYHDQQNGFVFGTNAAGIQYDAQVRNQGRPEDSWDGSWDVMTRVTETGWSAEFRIPLRTLRYGPAPQTWGVNFQRNIQRTRERTYWAPLPQVFELERLSSGGELRNLALQTPRNFKVLPYVVSSANRTFASSSSTDMNGDFGFDAKFGITPSLNLDASYNTDFAQVEVDNEQINLTRFNLRFPEKRPFFLENSGLFRVGKGNELDLFFSRRIGINSGGLVPIIGGGRLSGKVSGLNVGVLNMQTDSVGSTPGNNYSVLRASREVRGRSGFGFMFVNRAGTGSFASSDDWNRSWAGDARIGLGDYFTTSGFVARTETPGRSGRAYAYNVDTGWDDGQHSARFEYGLTGEDFNPEVGFVQKTGGYRRYSVRLQETMRQDGIRALGFREFLPHVNYTRYENIDGGLLTADLHVDNHWDWENGNFFSVALNGSWEGVSEPFEVYPGVVVPVGNHGGLNAGIRLNSDTRKPLSGRLQWDIGRFLTGNESSPRLQVVIRDSGRLSIDTTWTHRSITLPQGAFRTNLGNMRVTYNFSPSVFVQSLLQYNDRSERWSTNLRFHWLETAGTGLFVVYNDTESLDGLGPVNRVFIVKYVRQFDLLN